VPLLFAVVESLTGTATPPSTTTTLTCDNATTLTSNAMSQALSQATGITE